MLTYAHIFLCAGRRGYPGAKGEPGSGYHPTSSVTDVSAEQPVAAFSASLDEDVPRSTEYRVLRFNVVLANHGTCYNPTTGVFTAPFNGSYLIGFGGVGYDGQSVLLHLVRNGQRLLSAFDNSGCSCVGGRNQNSGGGPSGHSKDSATVSAHGGTSINSIAPVDGVSSVSNPGTSDASGDSERAITGEKVSSTSTGSGGTTSGHRATAGGADAQGGGGKCAGSASNAGVVPLDRGDRVWVELPDGYGMHNALYHHYASFYGYLLYTAAKVNAASLAMPGSRGDEGNLASSGLGKQ